MSPTTWRLADLFAKHHFLLNGLGWGGMPLHAVRKDLEEGRLSVLPIEDVPSGWLDSTDVGGVANEVTAWARRPMVCRSPEANSGGNGQSAETAGHQEEGETVCENLAGRRCPYREKRRIQTCDLSNSAAETLRERFAFFNMHGSHILGYLVAGPDGSLEAGRRRYSWVWYRRLSDADGSLAREFTDASGHVHQYSLPAGATPDAARDDLVRVAEEILPPQFAAAVSAERSPVGGA